MKSGLAVRSRPTALALLIAITATSVACRPPQPARPVTETIAGVPRARAFASATAYEAFLRAEVAISRGAFEEAARQLELATFADDTDGWLCARRAELLLFSGARADGLEAAQSCARRFAEQAASWIVLGEALLASGRASEATAAFTRALAEAPDDPEVREAVALGQGSSTAASAAARESAPQARAGDRTIAQRALLDAGRDRRPTLATVRRLRARQALERGAFREADAWLTPLHESHRATVEDRVAIIEARVADGRPRDAAPLVSTLAMLRGEARVSPVELARLWLLVERYEAALEDADHAALEGRSDAIVRRLRGAALVRLGRVDEGIMTLATIDASDGEFVEAQIEAAEALERAARADLSERVLAIAVDRLGSTASRSIDRDRLRIARAKLLLRRSERARAAAALGSVETSWGRQQRGMLSARGGDSGASVLRDLRERSGDRREDGRADAWIVLVCQRPPSACSAGEIDAAMSRAERSASDDPVTLRARASRARDASEAAALRWRARVLDPLSP